MGNTITEECSQCLLIPGALQAVPNAPCFQDLAPGFRIELYRA